MKERLSNVLAWFAFINGGIFVVALIALILDARFLFDPIEFYVEIVGFSVIASGVVVYSSLIWILLYVLNGNPRFLSWVK